MIVVGTAMPVGAKLVCPPGRFAIVSLDGPPGTALQGGELALGNGTARIAGACGAVRAKGFDRESRGWLLRVVARWRRCRGTPVAVRARFDLSANYCTRLEGFVRMGSHPRARFVAERIPECGNGLRERGEQCDGTAGCFLAFGRSCCRADCRLESGWPVTCDLGRGLPCEGEDEICVVNCSFGGICVPRAEVECGTTPVCDCNGQVTYANVCEAWDAGAGVANTGACPPAP